MSEMTSQSPGPSTDRHNDPVIDPTLNVKELIGLQVNRLDDMAVLRSQHTEEMAKLRETHGKEIAAKESARLDAIRAVDAAAVKEASLVQEARANTLAALVATTAEAARNTLASTIAPLTTAIAALQQAQYTGAGAKQQTTETRQTVTFAQGLLATAVLVAGLLFAFYAKSGSNTPTVTTPTVVCTATYHPSPCP